MKKYVGSALVLLLSLAAISAQAAASSSVKIALNNAYLKRNGTYAVVVKDTPGAKLALYVNDRHPTYATVNKHDWATFRGVKVSATSKVSFTNVYTHHGKTYQKPINYVRYVAVTNGKLAFMPKHPVQPQPTKPARPAPTTNSPTTAIKAPSSPTPAPAPQPVCTNGTYVNTYGTTVCRPEATPTAPAGATAQCVDGTYSFSQTHRGTCSHHGGVAQWL